MAASDVSICNQALTWLGANTIMSLNDNSNEAIACKATYEETLNDLLTQRMWTFATQTIELSAPIAGPAGQGYAYLIPNTLKIQLIHKVFTQSSNNPLPVEWARQGQYIISQSAGPLYCVCIVSVTPERMPAYFTQALSACLAADMAMGLTRSIKIMDKFEMVAKNKTESAAAADGRQGTSETFISDALINVRASGGTSINGWSE